MSETLLPLWQCHKRVRAAKIVGIKGHADFGATLELEHGVSVAVSAAYCRKHEPGLGGYYVRYADGYESWSPAEAFEEGYAPIDEAGDNAA